MTLWAINRAAHGRRENYAIKIIQIKEGFCVCESGFTMYEFFKMGDRVLKAAAVSYTHLDVYKRQAEGYAAKPNFPALELTVTDTAGITRI